MPDNFYLTGPTGSQMNIASLVRADPGVDFGDQDLLKAGYAENPAQEGAQLAYEYVNHRTMMFPVRIASTSALAGAAGGQAWLRTLARPGATLDVQLDGVPTAEMVRFDVLTGRFELDRWNTHMFTQTDRIDGTLKLDVQPFGYWPTMIVLASAASIGIPGRLTIAGGGSIFGDVPGLARIEISPTTGATSFPAGSWYHDFVGWSNGAKPSFTAFWPAGSLVALNGASLTAYPYAPGLASQALFLALPSTNLSTQAGGWLNVGMIDLPTALEPAYRGNYRLFAYVKVGPSQTNNLLAAGDVAVGGFGALGNSGVDLASAGPMATVPVAVASGSPGVYGQPSPALSLVDLGQITIPSRISAPIYRQFVRTWIGAPSGPAVPTTEVYLGGMYLMPLDGEQGILPLHFADPSIGSASPAAGFTFRADTTTNELVTLAGDVKAVRRQALDRYRGDFPRAGASNVQIDVLAAGRKVSSALSTPAHSSHAYAWVGVSYRPRFAFLKGL